MSSRSMTRLVRDKCSAGGETSLRKRIVSPSGASILNRYRTTSASCMSSERMVSVHRQVRLDRAPAYKSAAT